MRSYDKNYHFFKNQLYDLMYTEDKNEIKYYGSGDSSVPYGQYPTKQDALLYHANRFFKVLSVLFLELIILAALFLIPGVGFTVPLIFLMNIWFLPAMAYIFTKYETPTFRVRDSKQKQLWLYSTTFLSIFPSLLKFSSRMTAWWHDMFAAVPRLVRYYERKGTDQAIFEDAVKRGGAWGSLFGSICTIGAIVVAGVLLFNPYTLMGLIGIASTVVVGLFVAPHIVKCFEFLGRLAGIFYTKKRAEDVLDETVIRKIGKMTPVSDQKKASHNPVPSVFRSTAQICRLALQDCLNPRNFSGRQSIGNIIFHPSYVSRRQLSHFNKKGFHLESETGKMLIQNSFLSSEERYARILKKNLGTRGPREENDAKQEGVPDDVIGIIAAYASDDSVRCR